MIMMIASTAFILSAPVPTPPRDGFEFVEDTARIVSLRQERFLVVGRLNAKGEFEETRRFLSNGIIGGGVQLGTLLNGSPLTDTPLYELNDGVLIPGTFDEAGYFVPDRKGKSFKLSAFKYTTDAPKIWNLPGYFLPEEKAKRVKALLAAPTGGALGPQPNTGDRR